jgi:hypothetical protein
LHQDSELAVHHVGGQPSEGLGAGQRCDRRGLYGAPGIDSDVEPVHRADPNPDQHLAFARLGNMQVVQARRGVEVN